LQYGKKILEPPFVFLFLKKESILIGLFVGWHCAFSYHNRGSFSHYYRAALREEGDFHNTEE
jgi:hypothetical protein